MMSTRNRRTLSTERTISVVHRFTSVRKFDWKLEVFHSKLEVFNSKLEVFNSKLELLNSKPELCNSKLELCNSKLEVLNSNLEVFNSKLEDFISKLELFNSILETRLNINIVQDTQRDFHESIHFVCETEALDRTDLKLGYLRGYPSSSI